MKRENLPKADMFVVWFQAAAIIFIASSILRRTHHLFPAWLGMVAYAAIAAYAVAMAFLCRKFWAKFRRVRTIHDPDETRVFNQQSRKLMLLNNSIFLALIIGNLLWISIR